MINLLKKNDELWDLFTRAEEYNSATLDKYNRFLYKYSKYKQILKPKVSEYLVNNGFRLQWPNNKKFALCLTHDIDDIFPTLKYRCVTSLLFTSKFQINKSFNRFFKKENPYWNFKDIIKLENKYDAKSTFNIMTDNHNYDANELKDELRNLIENGNEIGLHGGNLAYDNFDIIKKQKEKLEKIINKKVIGYRNHFLKIKIPETWKLLNRAGFKYDTTFGYSDHVGFRNGMCHPFKPFDLDTKKQIDIIELPLIVMDVTLREYMGLNAVQSWNLCKKLIDTVEDVGGVLTILFHNKSFDNIYYKGWSRLYERLLDYCYKKNAWLTSGENIIKWVHKNNWC